MKKACDEAVAEKRKEHGEDAELDDEEKKRAYERARDRKAKDKKARDKKAADKAAKDKAAADKAARDAAAVEAGEDADPDHREDFEPNKAKDSVTKDELPKILKEHGDKIRAQMTQLAQAREAVRPLVGVVSIGMDSAESVYAFALKQAGVKTEGVDPSAFPALVEMAVQQKKRSASPIMGMDTSGQGEVDIDAIFSTKAA
jgi:stage V sporulation protein SpoVS